MQGKLNQLTNCVIVDDDAMTRKIIQNLVEETKGLNLVATCSSAIEAANVLREEQEDLLLLDVEMPEMTGLELLESLKVRPQVILITSKEEYAISAFDLDVLDYIVKPVNYPRFLKAVQKAMESPASGEPVTSAPGKLFVKVDHSLVGLDLDEIIMVEAMADYVRIYTPAKRYTVYSSMKGVVAKLPENLFMRVHRSYIVNLSKIESIEDNTVVIGGNLIPVGVTYQKTLMSRLNTL